MGMDFLLIGIRPACGLADWTDDFHFHRLPGLCSIGQWGTLATIRDSASVKGCRSPDRRQHSLETPKCETCGRRIFDRMQISKKEFQKMQEDGDIVQIELSKQK
jgi:hypothetical protein